MAISGYRWKEITPSQFPWEKDALDYIRQGLPDQEPYRAWSNFEFRSDYGDINEVDLFVLSPQGLFLIEIKSRPGILSGDASTWTWKNEGKEFVDDNPLILANRKTKKLAALLKKQPACSKFPFPYIETLIFCSHPTLQCNLQGINKYRVCLRDKSTASSPTPKGIISAIKDRNYDGVSTIHKPPIIDPNFARAISLAMEQAGIKKSQKSKKVGDYILEKLLFENPSRAYQDWEAKHNDPNLSTTKRRIRIYNIARNLPQEERQRIERAARREYQIIENLTHPSILPVETFTEHELGPALIFKYWPNSMRLDHYLTKYSSRLSVDVRLELIRKIAEAIKYAHEKKVVHRALSPQSILVLDHETRSPQIRIFNWQVSYRNSSSSGNSSFLPTFHIEELVEDISTLYIAPEAKTADPETLGQHLDVFSLGAIAYHIFSGKTPALSYLDLTDKLRIGNGLQISAVLDGAGKEIQELIQLSTHPDITLRFSAVSEFLEQLDAVEEELTRPVDDTISNPLEAKVNDRLEGGFTVKNRLGSGSSAIVMLVERGGKEVVLKLASNTDYNNRLQEEYETLKKLRHPNIIEAYEIVKIKGFVGFTIPKIEGTTLGHRIRSEGRLSIDQLDRFGQDLLEAVKHLEQVGIHHRDIKSENIGITAIGRDDRLGLVLFDFSLSKAPLESIRAGTPPYLEPFLSLRKPPRWDLYAERFAVAMTLYEMAAGVLPKWGDGQSSPDLLNCEVTINSELFDTSLRNSTTDFFKKALSRDYKKRHDNAEEMLEDWKSIFKAVDSPKVSVVQESSVDKTALLLTSTLSTRLAELGLSTRAISVVDRLNVITVQDLLGIPPIKIYQLRGVGNKTRKELVELANALRVRFPERQPTITLIESSSTTNDSEPEYASIDLIAQQIAGKKASKNQQKALSNNPSIISLRNTIAEIIQAHGGAMSQLELINAVLAARGSIESEDKRKELAETVINACIETEKSADTTRFISYSGKNTIVITINKLMSSYTDRLGKAADELAELDPLATPDRVIETLRDVPYPDEAELITDVRLVKLAVACSKNAALSSRMEIYPKAMHCLRAIKLAQGALFGANELTIKDITERVLGRYPEAEPLPTRPALDRLLIEAGLELEWQSNVGTGCYKYKDAPIVSNLSNLTSHKRQATPLSSETSTFELPPEIADARIFDTKLRRAYREGAFLVLMVPPRDLLKAEAELKQRFDLAYKNLDELLITAMHKKAAELNVDWKVVINADVAPRDSKDWKNLQTLVSYAMKPVEEQLGKSDKTILLSYPGLLARYDRIDLLARLREKVAITGGELYGLWLLMAGDEQSQLPVLDGKAIPVISTAQWARIPTAWLSNAQTTNGNIPREG